MASKAVLMASGMPAMQASKLGYDAASSALTATGSTQVTALVLTGNYAVFGTVASSTGAILPAGNEPFIVINGGVNALSMYPPVGGAINGGTANAAFSVTAGKTALFINSGTAIAAILSA